MSILAEVFADLFKMFVADARMTAAILALVGAVAAVIHYHVMAAEGAGAVLLLGCLVLVVGSVVAAARRHRG